MSSASRPSEAAVKPTRSTNSTETSRRSAAAGSRDAVAAGAAVATAPSPSLVPHSPQKFTSAAFGVPHDGHGAARLAPHWRQNLRPSSFGVEHAAQITSCPASWGDHTSGRRSPERGRVERHRGNRVRGEAAAGRRPRRHGARRRARRPRRVSVRRVRQRARLDPPRVGDEDGRDAAVVHQRRVVIDAATAGALTPWRIKGSYFESCNCEAICPCRMVSGVKGGRSTYGICFGVLSWLVEDGKAGEVDLTGLAAAFVIRYDDDEPGSPWSFIVHVDERGTHRATAGAGRDPDRRAGRRGGPAAAVGVEAERADRGRGEPDRDPGRRLGARAPGRPCRNPPREPPVRDRSGRRMRDSRLRVPGHGAPRRRARRRERPVRVGAERQLRLCEPVRLLLVAGVTMRALALRLYAVAAGASGACCELSSSSAS